MTEQTATAAHLSTTAIRAQDFSPSTKDVNRDKWTNDKLYALIVALAGAPVLLIADRQSGYVEFDVRITGYYRRDGWWNVIVERANGTRTDYWAPSLGDTIVPMPTAYGEAGHGAKWNALRHHLMERLTVSTAPGDFGLQAASK